MGHTFPSQKSLGTTRILIDFHRINSSSCSSTPSNLLALIRGGILLTEMKDDGVWLHDDFLERNKDYSFLTHITSRGVIIATRIMLRDMGALKKGYSRK